MHEDDETMVPIGSIAVIFITHRTSADAEGYVAAAAEMEALAAQQPGYLGIDSARQADGFGITVSYWADDAAAAQWRDHPRHAATRELGRAHWYADYSLLVTRVERRYRWMAKT
jgi:heme-degrading monooxygenase HmoA